MEGKQACGNPRWTEYTCTSSITCKRSTFKWLVHHSIFDGVLSERMTIGAVQFCGNRRDFVVDSLGAPSQIHRQKSRPNLSNFLAASAFKSVLKHCSHFSLILTHYKQVTPVGITAWLFMCFSLPFQNFFFFFFFFPKISVGTKGAKCNYEIK